MTTFKITADTAALDDLARELAGAGRGAPAGAASAVNRVAGRARPVVVGVLTRQTGLPKRTISKAVRLKPATPGRPVAALASKGGDISLKYFGAREGSGGVTARVKGKAVSVPGAFTLAGRPGHRKPVKKLGGHVFVNAEGKKWRGHIRKVRSGVYIPVEMASGATLAAFEQVAARELPSEGVKVLAALLPGK